MKKVILLGVLTMIMAFNSFGQSEHFETALTEIKEMLNEKKPYSLKRALFLVENAYMQGTLNWSRFDTEVDRYLPLFQKMIDINGFGGYETSKNWAIHTYMTDTLATNNGYQRFHYDYENFYSDTLGLVWNLLMNKDPISGAHLGNCRSLPLLYKVWCDEFGAKAYLSNLPMHLYIRQQDEQGIWWNIELTSFYRYMPTEDYIVQFKIKDEARSSGLYMKALTAKECLVILLEDLIHYYEAKTEIFYDQFVESCYELGLKYWPSSTLQLRKFDCKKYRLDSEMEKLGLNDSNQLNRYPELLEQLKEIDKIAKYIDYIGYTKVSPETYAQMFKEIEEKSKNHPKQK